MIMARVILYKGNEVKEMFAENADKFLADGWSAEQPKVSKKPKSAEKKTETTTDEA